MEEGRVEESEIACEETGFRKYEIVALNYTIYNIGPASLEILTAMLMKMQALRFLTPCRLVSSYRLLSLDGLTMKMEAVRSTQTSLATSRQSVLSRNILVPLNTLVTFEQPSQLPE